MKNNLKLSTLAALAALVAVPTASFAADGHRDHRQSQQGQWQSLGIGAAVVGIAGLLTHNDTLAAIGGAGALYSGYRYETDNSGPYNRNRYGYDGGYNDSRNVPIIGSGRYDQGNNRGRSNDNSRWTSNSSGHGRASNDRGRGR